MFRKCLAAFVATAVVVVLTSAAMPKEDDPKSPKVEGADFTGKIVAITVKGPVGGVWMVEVHVSCPVTAFQNGSFMCNG